jgi:hypothetical protein
VNATKCQNVGAAREVAAVRHTEDVAAAVTELSSDPQQPSTRREQQRCLLPNAVVLLIYSVLLSDVSWQPEASYISRGSVNMHEEPGEYLADGWNLISTLCALWLWRPLLRFRLHCHCVWRKWLFGALRSEQIRPHRNSSCGSTPRRRVRC